MQAFSLQLLSNASATPTAPTGETANQLWPGGQGVFSVVGTFGGATVTLEFLGPDGATLVAAGGNTTLTATGAGVFNLHPCWIIAAVTGGSPSGLYARADRIPV
jgi:hypothetical protein